MVTDTQNIGWVRGMDLQLDFGAGDDAAWNVSLASSEGDPVPGAVGIVVIAATGLARRRRR